MNIVRTFIIMSAATMLATTPAWSQTEEEHEIGVLFFLDYNMHSADFKALPNVGNCCPQFTSGDGFGYTVGLVYERPIDIRLSFATRLLLADNSALLLSEEPVVFSIDGEPATGTFEHTIDASLMTAGIEPLLFYHMLDNLTIGVGANLSVLWMRDYHQKEEITSPEHAVFYPSGLRVRNERSGEIENSRGLLFAGVAVVRMRIPLGGGDFALYPEVSYLHSFSNLADGVNWKPHALRAGVAIQTHF